MEKIGMHCIVSGKVQKVWFRASTCQQAEKMGLTGSVQNLPSGEVEVWAYGDKAQIKQLYEWLQQGPPLARVENVTYEELTWIEVIDFKVI
jgi:acylphosphatase